MFPCKGRWMFIAERAGNTLMKQLLSLKPHPDGVFFPTMIQWQLERLHAILDAGLRVPEDIAVIGSGTSIYDDELRVPLSSIDQQTKQIGERTARLTLSLLESKTRSRTKTVIVEPQLVVRASTNRKQHTARKSKTKAGIHRLKKEIDAADSPLHPDESALRQERD